MAHPLIPDLEKLAQATLEQVAPEMATADQELPTGAPSGYTLHAVQLHSHRIPMTLQVLVQRRDGGDISLDECARLSAPLGDAIEAAGLLGEAPYVLEVSSPGVSEVLRDDRDFRSFRGFPVAVLHRDARGSEARSEGLLLARTDAELQLNIRGRIRRIPREALIQVRLVTAGDAD